MTSHIPRALLSLLLVGTMVKSAPAQGPAAGGWTLTYAVDSLGRTTQGDKNALVTAVRAGQPVRVKWGIGWRLPDGTPGALDHVAEPSFLTVHHGEVFAQLAPILGQAPSAREPSISFKTEGNQIWYGMLDTTGRLVGYFVGATAQQTTRIATSWYVQGAVARAPGG